MKAGKVHITYSHSYNKTVHQHYTRPWEINAASRNRTTRPLKTVENATVGDGFLSKADDYTGFRD